MSVPSFLLDTRVTWQDVESELQKSLKTNARFGEKRKVINLGSMKGFSSRIALIEPDWSNRLPEDDIPDKFIVKIASSRGIEDLFDVLSFLRPEAEMTEEQEAEKQQAIEKDVKFCHSLEINTYNIIARENNPNLRTIKVYASRAFSQTSPVGFLVCEYIENVHFVPMYGTIPYEEMLPVIDTLAAFSAMGERISEEEKKETAGETQLEDIIKDMFPEKVAIRIRSLLQEALGDSYKEKIDDTMNIVDLICGATGVLENYSKISEFLGHSPVLMHSDLWSANLLCVKDPSNGSLDFKALIDFATTSFSSPGLDICSLLITCLSTEDRRTHLNDFLNRYHESFKANLRGARMPYTLEQLYDSYDLYYIPTAVQILPIVWSLAKHNGGEEAMNAAREKMIGIINELLVIQKSNLEKFPEFFEVPNK